MKRFVYSITSKSKVTPEDYNDVYDTWLNASLASYTLDRYRQASIKSMVNDLQWICVIITTYHEKE